MTKIKTQPIAYKDDSGLCFYEAEWLTVDQVKNRLRLSREAKEREPVLVAGVWYWKTEVA